MESHELGQLERKVTAAFSSDGAMETLMGLALGFAGLNMAMDMHSPMMGPLPVLVLLLARVWKRRITYPRLGYADIAKRTRVKRLTTISIFLLVLVIALLLIEYVPAIKAKLLMGTIISAVITMPVFLKGLRHFYLFGALNFALILVSYHMQFSAGYAIGATGAVLLLVGLFRLKNFLDQNPKPIEEATLGA